MSTTAQHIATDLARKIVSREIAPHAAMPPIRSIAQSYDVNVTTAQRTVDRLVASGLVQKRGTKQFCAVDFARESSIDTVALVLGLADQMPLLARDYFADLLAVHAETTITILRALIVESSDQFIVMARRRVEDIEHLMQSGAADSQTIALQEFNAYRDLTVVLQRPVIVSLLNTLCNTIVSHDYVMQIVFADPQRLADKWTNFADAVAAQISPDLILTTVEGYLQERRLRHIREFEIRFGVHNSVTE